MTILRTWNSQGNRKSRRSHLFFCFVRVFEPMSNSSCSCFTQAQNGQHVYIVQCSIGWNLGTHSANNKSLHTVTSAAPIDTKLFFFFFSIDLFQEESCWKERKFIKTYKRDHMNCCRTSVLNFYLDWDFRESKLKATFFSCPLFVPTHHQ